MEEYIIYVQCKNKRHKRRKIKGLNFFDRYIKHCNLKIPLNQYKIIQYNRLFFNLTERQKSDCTTKCTTA